jgi:hypothetical protein
MAANFFKCLLPFLLLIIHLVSSVPTKKSRKCIVCHKRLDRKLETTRKNLPQRHDLEACFGVSYDEPGILCSACRRAVYRYKKTGKTFFHVSIFILVQLNIIL